MHRNQIKSSFNGIIDEMPDIGIDNFEDTDCKAYFLSHCHADHTSGLFSEALLIKLKRRQYYIYMSELSAAIVKHESGGSDIVDFVKPLPIGTTTVTVPRNPMTDDEDHYLTVTLIPAAHCFGSVMFLFTTMYKTILYTGDFRMSSNSLPHYAQLHEDGKIVELDALYVDTTFLTSDHTEFPKRTDSVDTVIRHIKAWLHRGRVALHTSARYGYEFVFNQIFKQLGEKVYIGGDIWNLYSQFPKTIIGVTNDPSNSKIHLCRNRSEGKSHEDCLPNQQADTDFLYIHFSALKWTNYKTEDPMIEIKKEPKYRIDVCFATHCSKSELEYFINYLSPKKVVGFPNVYKNNDCELNEIVLEDSHSEEEEEEEDDDDEESEKECKLLDEKTMEELFGD